MLYVLLKAGAFSISRAASLFAKRFVSFVGPALFIALSACTRAETLLTTLSSEIQVPKFEGVSNVRRDFYVLRNMQAFIGDCDARTISLAVSLNGTSWNDSRTFFDSSSDLDCADGKVSLKFRPNSMSFGSNLVDGSLVERMVYVRAITDFGYSNLASIKLVYHVDFTPPIVNNLVVSAGSFANAAEVTTLLSADGNCTTVDGSVTVVWADSAGKSLTSAVPCTNGSFTHSSANIAFMDDGVITVTATQAADLAENAPIAASLTFTKDVVAPVIGSLTTIASVSSVVNKTPSIRLTGTMDATPSSGLGDLTAKVYDTDSTSTVLVDGIYNSTSTPALSAFAAGVQLTPSVNFSTASRYTIDFVLSDRAGNTASLSSSWDYCPYLVKTFDVSASIHPHAGDDFAFDFRIPAACGQGSVVIEAVGEKGRDAVGGYSTVKGRGAGGAASAVFAGPSVAGKLLTISFKGAGLGGGATVGTATTSNFGSGGRYAAAYLADASVVVIAGGGGGAGAANLGTLIGDATVTNEPGVGGANGPGMGKCDPSGSGNARTRCGVNADAQATVGVGSAGAGGAVSCTAGTYTSPTTGENQSGLLTFAKGGQGLIALTGGNHGGGGGGGWGGGGGGGGAMAGADCAGASGGGGGSHVIGQVAGTAVGNVAARGNGAPIVRVTMGLPAASALCDSTLYPNYIYVPPVEGFTTNSTASSNAGFCFSKFEASNKSSKAASDPTLSSWVSLNRASASSACVASSTKLMSATHWQEVAEIAYSRRENWISNSIASSAGMVIGVTSSNVASGTHQLPDASANPNACTGTTSAACTYNATGSLARRTHLLSDDAYVWDMGGNIVEMTSDTNGAPFTSYAGTYDVSQVTGFTGAGAALFGLVGPSTNYMSWTSGIFNLGQFRGSSNATYMAIRGGDYTETNATSGIFFRDYRFPVTEVHSVIGFRCVSEVLATGF